MRQRRLTAFVLLAPFALGAPAALAAETKANTQVTVRTPAVKARPRVPQFPADVKARHDRLWNAASPEVKAWAKQVAPGIAAGTGDPEALARAAVRTKWPNLHVAGSSDALTFLALYDSAESLRAWASAQDTLTDQSQEQQLKMQMVMDRMTKADAAASNLEKKLSETAMAIVANMK